MANVRKRKFLNYTLPIHLFFILLCIFAYVIPLLIIVSISLSSDEILRSYGYRIIPRAPSILSYRYILKNPWQLIASYKVTAIQSVAATFLSVLVMSLCAYPLSRASFKYRKPVTFFIFFTMLFGGGLIPTYILNTTYLHLGNKIWVYILPGMASAFYIIIFRTFFQQLSISLVESAKIDGASEIRIFFQIVIPQSTPVLATISLFLLLDHWNDWYTCLVYIRDEKLYTLQYLLQRILNEAEFVSKLASRAPPGISLNRFELPTESLKFAMCIVAAGPMLVIFPFFQKYFTRGLVIGSVKG